MQHPTTDPFNRQVVVVGGGFAGLQIARRLGRAGVGVTLIDRTNYHLFQPLLYQVATAALSPADIAEPIRRSLRRYPSVQTLFDEVVDIDAGKKEVLLASGTAIRYGHLVLATGSRPAYFGKDQWAASAPGLKTVEDARHIRSLALLAFELAERTACEQEQARLLSIVVVGGGPTGVEMAGSLAELAKRALKRDFRNIRPESANILLVEGGNRLLASFSQDLASYASSRLARLGVTVRTGTMVADITPTSIKVGDEVIPAGLVIWAAGVQASPVARLLKLPLDRQGRIRVDEALRVTGVDDVFALGDIATFAGEDGKPLPGLAQVAKQQGEHLGRELAEHLATGRSMRPFRYRSRGNTAIIGRHAAVFETRRIKLKGWVAWAGWAIIHVYLLVGFQNRLMVTMQWLWRYFTYERGARLIAGLPNAPSEAAFAREKSADARPGLSRRSR